GSCAPGYVCQRTRITEIDDCVCVLNGYPCGGNLSGQCYNGMCPADRVCDLDSNCANPPRCCVATYQGGICSSASDCCDSDNFGAECNSGKCCGKSGSFCRDYGDCCSPGVCPKGPGASIGICCILAGAPCAGGDTCCDGSVCQQGQGTCM